MHMLLLYICAHTYSGAKSIQTHTHTRTRWITVHFRYRTWAEWMLSFPLCCSIIALPPHIHTHACTYTHRELLYREWKQWCEVKNCDIDAERKEARVCVCLHACVCMWAHECVRQYDSFQSSTSWPADSPPSEILSEDYKTNQQTVIAAASLWLDHNPAAAVSSAKRKNERREERDAGKERDEKRDK